MMKKDMNVYHLCACMKTSDVKLRTMGVEMLAALLVLSATHADVACTSAQVGAVILKGLTHLVKKAVPKQNTKMDVSSINNKVISRNGDLSSFLTLYSMLPKKMTILLIWCLSVP